MGSFILFSQSYFVINLGQKKGKKKEEKEKKETSPCSAGKSFHAKEQECTNSIGSYHCPRDSSFYSGGFRKVLA